MTLNTFCNKAVKEAIDRLVLISSSASSYLGSLYYTHFNFDPNAGYYGQGEVSRSIGIYFRPIKEKVITWQDVRTYPGNIVAVVKRRTNKMTKAPVPLKSWKGKR